MNVSQLFILALVKSYQSFDWAKRLVLLQFFGYSCECKHTPSCSAFLREQVERRGTISGLFQGLVRLSTCW